MNVASIVGAGKQLAQPTVLLYNKQGPSLVPMSSKEIREDASATAALKAARTTVNWFAKHIAETPFATPSSPVRIALQAGYNNAYWAGSENLLTVGRGDGGKYQSFATLDTVAHELAHSRQPAGRSWSGEAGAVSESVADVVAEVIDGGDWKLGGEITAGGFRDLSAPKIGHLSLVGTNADIHTLAGLSSLAAVRSAKVVGGTQAAQLWWNTSQGLGATPTLQSLAEGTVASALKFWGAGTREAQAVRDAWVSVGVLR